MTTSPGTTFPRLLRSICAALAACGVLAISAPGASATSTLGPSSASLAVAGNWTYGSMTLNSVYGLESAPAAESGTITTWRLRSPGSYNAKLVVLHPSGGDYVITAATSVVTTAAGLNVYSANLPIESGDLVGLDGPGAVTIALGSSTLRRWLHAPSSVGTVLGSPDQVFTTYVQAFNVDIAQPRRRLP